MSEKDLNDLITNDLEYNLEALRLLEHSAIGKSGSRGYGQIKFHFSAPFVITAKDYKDGTDNYKNASQKIANDTESLKDLASIKLTYPVTA